MQLGLMPMIGLDTIDMATANDMLVEFDHYLGPCRRPFGQQAFALYDDAGYPRGEVVELARLATRPGDAWATRVMLRLWREVCAPAWPYWTAQAAVAYSQNSRHEGRIYRFDGWKRVRSDAGSSGGGTWSNKRTDGDAVKGSKTLWLWRIANGDERWNGTRGTANTTTATSLLTASDSGAVVAAPTPSGSRGAGTTRGGTGTSRPPTTARRRPRLIRPRRRRT